MRELEQKSGWVNRNCPLPEKNQAIFWSSMTKNCWLVPTIPVHTVFCEWNAYGMDFYQRRMSVVSFVRTWALLPFSPSSLWVLRPWPHSPILMPWKFLVSRQQNTWAKKWAEKTYWWEPCALKRCCWRPQRSAPHETVRPGTASEPNREHLGGPQIFFRMPVNFIQRKQKM